MMNLKNLQKGFASGQLLTTEGMSNVKGGLFTSTSFASSSVSNTTTSSFSVTSDDKRRERPGGGITT